MTIHVHMVRSSMLDFECLSPQVYGRPSLGCLAKFSLKRPFNFTDSSPIRTTFFCISQVYVDESSSYLYIISEGEVYTLLSTKFCCTSCSPVVQFSRCVRWCYRIMVLVSRHGAAWNVSLNLLFSVADSVSKCIQTQHSSRSLDRHDKVSLVQKLKWKMKYQKFKI